MWAGQGGRIYTLKQTVALLSFAPAAQYYITPLYMASACGHANLVQLLLGAGADVTRQSRDVSARMACTAWHGFLRHGPGLGGPGTTWVAWHGVVQHGVAWHSMA